MLAIAFVIAIAQPTSQAAPLVTPPPSAFGSSLSDYSVQERERVSLAARAYAKETRSWDPDSVRVVIGARDGSREVDVQVIALDPEGQPLGQRFGILVNIEDGAILSELKEQ